MSSPLFLNNRMRASRKTSLYEDAKQISSPRNTQKLIAAPTSYADSLIQYLYNKNDNDLVFVYGMGGENQIQLHPVSIK